MKNLFQMSTLFFDIMLSFHEEELFGLIPGHGFNGKRL
jgi:hypothetical protein